MYVRFTFSTQSEVGWLDNGELCIASLASIIFKKKMNGFEVKIAWLAFFFIVIFCKEVSDHSMIKGEKICKSLLSSARGSFKSSDGEVNFFFQSVSHFVDKKDLHATLYKVSCFIKPWIKNSFYLYILKHIHVKFIRKHFFF